MVPQEKEMVNVELKIVVIALFRSEIDYNKAFQGS